MNGKFEQILFIIATSSFTDLFADFPRFEVIVEIDNVKFMIR